MRKLGAFGLRIDRRERLHSYRSIPVVIDLCLGRQARLSEGGLPVVQLSIMVQTY